MIHRTAAVLGALLGATALKTSSFDPDLTGGANDRRTWHLGDPAWDPAWHPAAADQNAATDGYPKFLMVTGYWKLGHEDADQGSLRAGAGGYVANMPWVMTLNTSMAIFGDDFGLKHMIKARGNNTSPLVGTYERSLEENEPCKSHSERMRSNATYWTHPQDMPSISLGCVWDGKVSVLSEAARLHPDYEFYGWMDIGMHAAMPYAGIFRKHHGLPWPHPSKLAQLPHDKVSLSHSGLSCDKERWHPYQFWHCVAATAFVIPKEILPAVDKLFYETVEKCIQFWSDGHTATTDKGGEWGGYACMSEQMIMSNMARDNPDMFNFVGHGWGAYAAELTTDKILFNERLAYEGTSDFAGWLGVDDSEEAEDVHQDEAPRKI